MHGPRLPVPQVFPGAASPQVTAMPADTLSAVHTSIEVPSSSLRRSWSRSPEPAGRWSPIEVTPLQRRRRRGAGWRCGGLTPARLTRRTLHALAEAITAGRWQTGRSARDPVIFGGGRPAR